MHKLNSVLHCLKLFSWHWELVLLHEVLKPWGGGQDLG
jgi:hypothetical protein